MGKSVSVHTSIREVLYSYMAVMSREKCSSFGSGSSAALHETATGSAFQGDE